VSQTWLTWWARRARPPVVGGLTVVFVGYNVLLGRVFTPPAQPGQVQAPDLLLGYSPARLHELLAIWQPAKATFLFGHLVFDNLYPLVYGSLLLLVLARLYVPWAGDRLRAGVGALPVIAVVADWGENLLLSLLMARYPLFWPGLAWLAAACTTTKWLAIGLSGLALLLGGVARGVQRASPPRGLAGP